MQRYMPNGRLKFGLMDRRYSGLMGGFTLVELLAVILIGAFLVLLGLPTLVGARQRTKEASCQSNLRQLGFALQSYTEANNDRLPGPVTLLTNARYNRTSTNELAWYLAERLGCPPPSMSQTVAPQLICPGRDGEPQDKKSSDSRADYVLNDGRGLGGAPFGMLVPITSEPLKLKMIAIIKSPASCAAILDADKANVNPTLRGWTTLPYQPVHGKKRNQLYFDWHVGSKAW